MGEEGRVRNERGRRREGWERKEERGMGEKSRRRRGRNRERLIYKVSNYRCTVNNLT